MKRTSKQNLRRLIFLAILQSLLWGCAKDSQHQESASQLSSEATESQRLIFADSVGIRLDHRSFGYSGGGLVYTASEEMPGIVAFFRDDHTSYDGRSSGYIRECQPRVAINIQGLGATVGVIDQYDPIINLSNLDGKTIEDIFGTYYGVKAGLAFFPLGFRGALAVNSSGVVVKDLSHMMGLNVDLSGTRITIEPRGNPSQECLAQKISTKTRDFEPQWILANDKAVAKVRQIVSQPSSHEIGQAVVEIMIQDHEGNTLVEPTRLTYHPRQAQYRKDFYTQTITFNVLGPDHGDACYLNLRGRLPFGDFENWQGKCPDLDAR